MKNLITTFFLFLGIVAFSQEKTFDAVSQQLKKSSKIDKSDKEVANLLQRFYNEALQSDKGELSNDTPEIINKTFEDNNLKNGHILFVFFMYQDYISKTAAIGKPTNSKYQVQVIDFLYKESKEIWERVPAIIYIYGYEALENDNKIEESTKMISEGLKEYPDSVPLKVYQYLKTKDQLLKEDLIKNHANHWMVLQYKL